MRAEPSGRELRISLVIIQLSDKYLINFPLTDLA